MRVVAAMSGGVDSAVAAARAVEAGHDVTGIHLALSRNPASYRSGARGCCTLEDANDARRAADVIGIPFYVWDLSERFHEDVVEDFMDEYAAGRTPNPCLRCNEKIKFAAVLDRALALGFDAVATGHYAQLRTGADGTGRDAPRGRPRQGPVLRARRAHPGAAAALAVPAGRLDQGRRPGRGGRARAAGRRQARQHDICFVADGDNAGWLREKLGDRAPNHGGAIVDERRARSWGGTTGTYGFTIGQRQGPPARRARRPTASRGSSSTSSRSPAPSPSGRARRSTIDRVEADRPGGAAPPRRRTLEGGVQLRAHGAEHRARVTAVAATRVEIELLEPARASRRARPR